MTWGSFSNVTKCHIRRQVVMLLTQSKTWNRHVKCLLSESFLAQILYNYTSVVCVAIINPDASETPSAHGVDETVDALLTNIIPRLKEEDSQLCQVCTRLNAFLNSSSQLLQQQIGKISNCQFALKVDYSQL